MPAFRNIWLMALCWLCLCLSACSPRALHEAQRLVAHADSLRAEGQMCSDSAQLAQAYTTLETWQWLYADDYAHACYHYGRLLRAKEDPVSAMQVFINATHSRTRDYHILGRVYNNMGDICHLASAFSLSYEMFAHSADMYLCSADTLLYYYVVNEMALELAEQGITRETESLLAQIEKNCPYKEVIAKTWETRAIMYRNTGQYDSAIFCIDRMKYHNFETPTGITIKAQSFSKLDIKDSAIIYAKLVLSHPQASYQNKFNALYILSHKDSTLKKDEAISLTSQREDIRHYEYEPEKEKLTLAIQLLKDDLNYVPNYNLIIAGGILVCLIGTILSIIFYKLKKRRRLLLHEEEKYTQRQQAVAEEINSRCKVLRETKSLKEQLHWKQYDKMCQIIDEQFLLLASKLQKIGTLTERDIQLCVLVLIDLSHAKIANMLYVEENSVGKLKERVAKKLKTSRKNLRNTLFNLILGE